jgi:hypothetical protein
MNNMFKLGIIDIHDNIHEVICFGYDHSIEYIKFVIGQINNIDRNSVLLFMNGTELSDRRTFRECNIDENSKIRMYCRIKTGFA